MIDTVRAVIEHPRFERFIVTLIIINGITLGLETSPTVMERAGRLLLTIDKLILAVFVVEIVARIAIHRLAFFKDPWSLFDLFVVGIALWPVQDGDAFAALRALRILRVLRLVTVVPSLRKVVAGLIGALPGMGAISMLLVLVYYVFAVIATKLYGQSNPELFGTIGNSLYTLFQAMTFDDWSNGIVKPLTEQQHRFAAVFVILFMVVSAFMVLNLFIGVVVTALDEVTGEGQPKITHPAGSEERLLATIEELRREVGALRAEIAGAPRQAG
jgi:voltage-gated sodium channel